MCWFPTQQKVKNPSNGFRVHDPWKNDTSNWAMRVEKSVMSHQTEGNLVPVNLSEWPDASANTGSLCGITLPNPLSLSSSPLWSYPPSSRWIFSHTLTLKTLLTARATARERESEENVCPVCVMWLKLQATLTKLCSSGTKKRIMHADEWVCVRVNLKVRWPPLYGCTLVNNSVSWGWLMSVPFRDTVAFCCCHSGAFWPLTQILK